MKNSLPIAALFLAVVGTAAAQSSLLLNFHSTAAADAGPVASPYLTTDPAHSIGGLSVSETTWNNFNTAAGSSSLLYSNGLAATGVSITFGGETAVDSGILTYLSTSAIRTNVNLGSGGAAPGQQKLLGEGSIYGADTSSTAPGRLGWLSTGATGGTDGLAIGLRIDGLAAGNYTIYAMARNTNSNVSIAPMDLFATTGANSDSFDFSLLTPTTQFNLGYASSGYNGEYNVFTEGDNYIAINVTVEAGESLFLASAGAPGGAESRGFLNMVEIVAVPEPSTVALALLGGGFAVLAVRRRKAAGA